MMLTKILELKYSAQEAGKKNVRIIESLYSQTLAIKLLLIYGRNVRLTEQYVKFMDTTQLFQKSEKHNIKTQVTVKVIQH